MLQDCIGSALRIFVRVTESQSGACLGSFKPELTLHRWLSRRAQHPRKGRRGNRPLSFPPLFRSLDRGDVRKSAGNCGGWRGVHFARYIGASRGAPTARVQQVRFQTRRPPPRPRSLRSRERKFLPHHRARFRIIPELRDRPPHALQTHFLGLGRDDPAGNVPELRAPRVAPAPDAAGGAEADEIGE
jgi:hypothetical protein